MVGVAVNVTLVPGHIVVPGLAAMLTDGVTLAVIVIVNVLLVAVALVTHVTLLVMTTLMASLLANDASVYVALLLPTFPPFFFHW